MKNIKSTIDLKSLSEQLSIQDLSLILLYKANYRNNDFLCSSKTELELFENSLDKNIMVNLIEILEKEKKGFFFKQSFTSDFEIHIPLVHSLYHLCSNSTNGVFRFLLHLPEGVFSQLLDAKLIYIKNSDDTYYNQLIFPNPKLIEILYSLKDSSGSFDFEQVIEVLIDYLLKLSQTEI